MADATEPDGAEGSGLDAIDYPAIFFHQQAPAHIDYIAALNGRQRPSGDAAPTAYCELGCGPGLTVCLLAASDPDGAYYGLDKSEAHIEWANALAARSGLKNAHFICADLAQHDHTTLPDFDFVSMHGLYAWVPGFVKDAIHALLTTKLKPGGLAYVSYNTMPGWGTIAPMRRFFLDHAQKSAGDPISQAEAALEILRGFREKKAPLFEENPLLAQLLDSLAEASMNYVAHEFLSESWTPLYFADVAADMAAAGLDFVGDGDTIENLEAHAMDEAFVETFAAMPDRLEREALKDFINNRTFRRDIYQRRGGAGDGDDDARLALGPPPRAHRCTGADAARDRRPRLQDNPRQSVVRPIDRARRRGRGLLRRAARRSRARRRHR